MKKSIFQVFLILTIVVIGGCAKNDNDDVQQGCNYDPCKIKATATEIQAIQKYLADSSITATQHCSGLFYKVTTEGMGGNPNACSLVEVRYKGKLANGTVFQETEAGKTYRNYLSNLIGGWINGIPYIKPGGKITLYIPPSMGYGSSDQKDAAGNVVIPGNSILIFEIDLIAFQ